MPNIVSGNDPASWGQTQALRNTTAARGNESGSSGSAPAAAQAHGSHDHVALSESATSQMAGTTNTASTLDHCPGPEGKSPSADLAEKLPDSMKHLADTYVEKGAKYNVDPKFLAAVSMHETAKGTSYAFKHKNNAMGVSGTTGPKRFKEVADSIEASAKALADPALYGKATHIKDIGDCYAPKGAANDPNNLNSSWIGGVTRNFKMLGGDPALPVVQR